MNQRRMAFIFLFIFFVFVALFIFLRSHDPHDPWEELLSVDLVGSEKCSDYINIFNQKIATITSNLELQNKHLASIQNRSIFKNIHNLTDEELAFVFGGYLGKYLNEMVARTAQGHGPIDGQSPRFQTVMNRLPINDKALNGRDDFNKDDTALIAAFYSVDDNTLFFEERLKLPPILWLILFIHEIRHAHDDIVVYGNNPPKSEISDSKSLEFELVGQLSGECAWMILKRKFMERWNEKSRSKHPSLMPAQLLIHALISGERPSLEYLQGNPEPLRRYIRSTSPFGR